MQENKQNKGLSKLLSLLPKGLSSEIIRVARLRAGGLSSIRELRLRRGGVCSMLIGRESIQLFFTVGRDEMDSLLLALCEGAIYAHRDSIASGYLSLGDGIRVGVCGRASYDGGGLVGISEISSMLFRIPTGECDFADEIDGIFRSEVSGGMLIFSPPGVGKTTALRSLAATLSRGRDRMRVAVVDERGEFPEEYFEGCEVDLLRGYDRASGIEIATRTMSPDIIITDEIGGSDAEALLGVVRCGIPIIATAHAKSRTELLSKPALKPLFDASVFDYLLGISVREGKYLLEGSRP